MPQTDTIDHKAERDKDTHIILSSTHSKRVILAGPGTGKSHLLAEAIRIKKKQGKTKFHAITFIGKLGDALADDLAGLADVTTLHSFARDFVLKHRSKEWVYLPKIKKIILDDLRIHGDGEVKVGDQSYLDRSQYYKAIGDDDVVYYATQICKEDSAKIPQLDLLLVDEFQDFNEIEDEFITLLASKSEVLIVGDDDQALYKWKGSHPKYIREKHSAANADYESHSLRWCSRCPEVVINTFHSIVAHHTKELDGRTDKEYIYYYPDKKADSELNPKIYILYSQYRSIAQNIRFELDKVLKSQKIKSVLIIGEGMSCGKSMLPAIANVLRDTGFRSVDYKSETKPFAMKQNIVDAYKVLIRQKNLVLAWRLIAEELLEQDLEKAITDNFNDSKSFIASLPDDFRKSHELNAKTLVKVLNGPKSAREAIADSSIEKLQGAVVESKKRDRELLTEQLIQENHHLKAPLANLDITVCSITGSKGLGADVIFLVGFDQGKLPAKTKPTDEEVYQMLVALTRTKKKFYLVSTVGCKISNFINSIDSNNYEVTKQLH
jgi:superfamily I DNA/RNA helicase